MSGVAVAPAARPLNSHFSNEQYAMDWTGDVSTEADPLGGHTAFPMVSPNHAQSPSISTATHPSELMCVDLITAEQITAVLEHLAPLQYRFTEGILSRIFSFCVECRAAESEWTSLSTVIGMRRTLMLTCSKWRNAVLATPEFWSTIHVDVHRIQHPLERLELIVPLWLQRARHLPLDLRLVYNEDESEADDEICDLRQNDGALQFHRNEVAATVLYHFLAAASRWRTIYIDVPDLTSRPRIPTIYGSAAHLRALHFRAPEPVSLPFAWAPNLARLHWTNSALVPGALAGARQMTSLCLAGEPACFRVVLAILEAFPDLVEFEVRHVGGGEDDVLCPVEHHSLQRLGLMFDDGPVGALWDALAVPRLAHVGLRIPDWSAQHNAFVSFLERANDGHILSLKVHVAGDSMTDGQLHEVLSKHGANLETLFLSTEGPGTTVSEPLLNALTPATDSGSPHLCPLLRYLVLKRCISADIATGKLSSMIASRAEGEGVTLEWFNAVVPSSFQTEVDAIEDVAIRHQPHFLSVCDIDPTLD